MVSWALRKASPATPEHREGASPAPPRSRPASMLAPGRAGVKSVEPSGCGGEVATSGMAVDGRIVAALLGIGHRDTLWAMNTLAFSYARMGQIKRAVPLLEETLELRKLHVGPEDDDTLQSMNNVG